MKLALFLYLWFFCFVSITVATPINTDNEAIKANEGNEVIKLGVFLPLSGKFAHAGQLQLAGIKLAHDQMPTVHGRKIELFIKDDQSKEDVAITVVQELVKDKIDLALGSYSNSLTAVALPILEQNKIIGMCTTCTNPELTKGKKYFFRACFSDVLQGKAAANFVANSLKFTKAFLLVDNESKYSIDLARYFKEQFEALGHKIVGEIYYTDEEQDFSKQLLYIASLGTEIVYLPNEATATLNIVKQAFEMGLPIRFMSTDHIDSPQIGQQLGKAANNLIHTYYAYHPEMPEMSELALAFTKLWQKNYPEIIAEAEAVIGYTSYLLLYNALAKSQNLNSDNLVMSLEQLKNVQSPLGNISIDKNHNTNLAVGIIGYFNGRQVYLGKAEAVE